MTPFQLPDQKRTFPRAADPRVSRNQSWASHHWTGQRWSWARSCGRTSRLTSLPTDRLSWRRYWEGTGKEQKITINISRTDKNPGEGGGWRGEGGAGSSEGDWRRDISVLCREAPSQLRKVTESQQRTDWASFMPINTVLFVRYLRVNWNQLIRTSRRGGPVQGY